MSIEKTNKFSYIETGNKSHDEYLKKYADYFNSYYYSDNEEIDDDAFDAYEQNMFNKGFAGLIEEEKKRIFNFNKSKNNHISVSLFKVKEDKKNPNKNIFSELQKQWFSKHKINYRSLIAKNNLFCAPKFDGGALKIEFDYDMEIIRIITRGGVDYTEKLKKNESIKNFVNTLVRKNNKFILITGEMVIKKSVFELKYGENRLDEYSHLGNVLKNPRNAVNSLIASENFEVFNDLQFIPLTDGTNPLIMSGYSIWQNIDNNTLLNLKNIYDNYKESDYLIDGLVIASKEKERIIKNNYPLNMVAIKFKSAGKQSKVIDIEWSQKKTGKLNPVLVIEPIILDGAEINRVTVYNYDQLINVYRCGIGAIVEIRKGDEITPKINKTIVESKIYNLPQKPTFVRGKNLYLRDNDEENIKQKFILGMKILNIDGVGPKLSEEIGRLTEIDFDIVEMFNPIHKPLMAEFLGTSSASFKNISKIYDIKNIPLNTVIEMLQINGCGMVLSMRFAEMLTNLKPFSRENIDENVFNYVVKGKGRSLIANAIKSLASFKVRVIKPIQINDDDITYEMSNNPPSMTKAEFKLKIKEKYPNSMHTTLTKNTKFLICDNKNANTSKVNKARRYNIKIVTYQEVLDNGFVE